MFFTTRTELLNRQSTMDAEAGALVTKVLEAHPGTALKPKTDEAVGVHDLSGWPEGAKPGPGSIFPHPQKILGSKPRDIGTCIECGEPEFLILDGQSGRTEPRCRGCFNAIIRQSLQHHQYTDEICGNCEITYDSIGLISGANHHPRPCDDRPKGKPLPDGTRANRLGWDSLLALNLIEVDEPTNILLVHHANHLATEHCNGCEVVRHPGCLGPGKCVEAVEGTVEGV